MNVPTLISGKWIDQFHNMSAEAQNMMAQLIQEMQTALSNNGFNIPNQPTTMIDLLPTQPFGNILYDSTLHVAKININGNYKTVTTS